MAFAVRVIGTCTQAGGGNRSYTSFLTTWRTSNEACPGSHLISVAWSLIPVSMMRSRHFSTGSTWPRQRREGNQKGLSSFAPKPWRHASLTPWRSRRSHRRRGRSVFHQQEGDNMTENCFWTPRWWQFPAEMPPHGKNFQENSPNACKRCQNGAYSGVVD